MQSSTTMHCEAAVTDPTTAVQPPGFAMMAAPSLVFQQVPRRGRVSFLDTRMEVRIVSLACLSDEMRSDIWYSPSDIESMRTEARDLCRYLRVNPQACPEEHTRGLELRISLERQCRKQLTVQGVVEAQRRCTDPAFLASLAQKCSMVPTEMAIAQAQKDYCNVYVNSVRSNPNMAPQIQQQQQSIQQPAVAAVYPPSHEYNNNNHNIQMPPPEVSMNHNNHHSYTQTNNNNYNMPTMDYNNPIYAGPPVAAVAPAETAATEEDELDLCCFEPIPLSEPDQSMMVLRGNKRMLKIFHQEQQHPQHGQDRPVRRRLEGYPAA